MRLNLGGMLLCRASCDRKALIHPMAHCEKGIVAYYSHIHTVGVYSSLDKLMALNDLCVW